MAINEASLVKVTIFGNDREAICTGEFPDGDIIGLLEVEVSDVCCGAKAVGEQVAQSRR